jgi:hypothetical protein
MFVCEPSEPRALLRVPLKSEPRHASNQTGLCIAYPSLPDWYVSRSCTQGLGCPGQGVLLVTLDMRVFSAHAMTKLCMHPSPSLDSTLLERIVGMACKENMHTTRARARMRENGRKRMFGLRSVMCVQTNYDTRARASVWKHVRANND